MGAGTTSFHFKRLFRRRSMLRRRSEMTASRSRKTLYSSPKPFSKSRFVPGISAGLKSGVFQKTRAKSKGAGFLRALPFSYVAQPGAFRKAVGSLSSPIASSRCVSRRRPPYFRTSVRSIVDGRRERPRAPTPAAVRRQQTGTERPHPPRRPPAGQIP
jgi:hypothetical protein